MRIHLFPFIMFTFFIAIQIMGQTTETFTTSDTWLCPDGVTSVIVECWGGGGPGGNGKGTSGTGIGGGGAGGAYAKSTISVTPGNSYTVTVGAAQTFASSGNPSWFSSTSTIYAQGGANGLSGIATTGSDRFGAGGTGSIASSIGTVLFKGGDGFTSSSNTMSAGGGGSAGSESNANSATNATGASAVTGGAAGGNGAAGSNQVGSAGGVPGGGGGGAWSTTSVTRSGGAGAAGQVVLTYTAILPVELTSFTASVTANHAILNWQTATEVNNYGFEVERRTEKVNGTRGEWENIGFVNGHGNSNSPKSYSFVDKTPLSGKSEYQLKQIDFDGKFEYSTVVDILLMKYLQEFELQQNYPNPFNPSTKISFTIPNVADALNASTTLKVYDVLGSEVTTLVNEKKSAGHYEINFNASNLASGMYFYTLSAGFFRETKKMIIIK